MSEWIIIGCIKYVRDKYREGGIYVRIKTRGRAYLLLNL